MSTRILKRSRSSSRPSQDVFIFQSLEAGHTKDTIRNLLRVDQDRVTRISKLRPKAKGTNQ